MAAVKLYGLLGKDEFGGGTSAAEFVAQLPTDGSPIEVRINSEGGSVVEGFAMANALYSYKGETTAIIEGQASSAASYVAASCSKIRMYEASYMVLHGPWAPGGDNAASHRQIADDLDRMAGLMRALYRRRGISDEQIDEWFAGGDHVLTPEDAQRVGLCDEIIKEPAKISAKDRARILARVKKPHRAERKAMDEYAKMDRKALRAAYKSEADEEKKAAIAKALAEKDDTTTGEGTQGRVNAEADEDPKVKALVDQLIGERKAHTDMRAELDALKAEQAAVRAEQEREKFVAEAAGIYSPDEAREHFKSQGATVARSVLAVLKKAGVGSGSMFKGGSPMGKATIGSTDIGDGMIMFQGMAYKDMGVAKRAREIRAELRKQDPKAKHGDIAKKALEMALAEKGRV